MGYCPYKCIFCKQVEDNGWGATSLAWTLLSLRPDELKTELDDGETLDVCTDCVLAHFDRFGLCLMNHGSPEESEDEGEEEGEEEGEDEGEEIIFTDGLY